MSTYPIKDSQRLNWIDAARGFAIFGIFIVNIGAFSAPYFLYGGDTEVWTSKMDTLILFIIDVFFQASFYTLFSILFGFGIQLQKDRLVEKGISVNRFFIRRLAFLTIIGLIHAIGIWHGDILFTYGVVGFLLLIYFNVKDRTIKVNIISLLGVFVGLFTLLMYQVRDYLDTPNQGFIIQAINNYSSASFSRIWEQNLHDWQLSNGGINILFLAGVILPMFLIGMYAARKKWFHQPEKYQQKLTMIWISSFIGFIILKLGPYLFGNPSWFSYVQDNIGGAASAIFYVTSITLLWKQGWFRQLMVPLQAVGKMAMTNYLCQSIISFWLFYGVGFGLYGKVDPLIQLILVLVIFILQMIGSMWWMKNFRFGPFEWLWRTLTYGKRQPFRRET
ncbi:MULTISPECIES: DUF418 domain-containing protein [Oceanobacillus]|uniref:DUF418 domain-containing protein n=1 Tax=Oceanobacillus kimchii TaxID=746691 RepID=A0ABQ5THJ5_9BACI|nr:MULTISPECIES: DUF418 domain-containing protein [Oceanobacillus]MBT2599061.1 DUF418 domain-containing protein [Oceanobacillus sp. ISL-74]MBT2651979.1 DUF418 domain-containing protein [Oceanobacillus sp. ISL-73]OEH54321.1 hypothetical protein AQ616_11205 [Oceanobacillus sp. E9]GLO65627.1 hypothetical protein MACH08_14110 [Oceanobacillus kimchii]